MNVRAHMLVQPKFLGPTTFMKMIRQYESGKSFPKLTNVSTLIDI